MGWGQGAAWGVRECFSSRKPENPEHLSSSDPADLKSLSRHMTAHSSAHDFTSCSYKHEPRASALLRQAS